MTPPQRRLDFLLYLALLALLTASTLNGLAFDWAILGTEITIHPDQIVLVLLVTLLACAFFVDRFRVALTRFDWIVVGFLLSNLVASLLYSPSRRQSLQGATLLALYAGMYFATRKLLAARPSWLPAAINWLLGLGVAQAIYCLIALALFSQGLTIPGVQRGHLSEASVALEGTFWEANLLGAYLALIATLFAIRYVWHPSGSNRTSLFGLFITSLVLPLTMTRSAGLAFVMGVAATGLVVWRFRAEIRAWQRRTVALALVLGSVLLLTVTTLNFVVSDLSRHPNFLVERWLPSSWVPGGVQAAPIDDRIRVPAAPATPTSRGSTGENELRHFSRSSVEGRMDAWRHALEAWRQRPFLGHGTLAGHSIVKEGWWYSSLVQALYDTGLVGFCLLLCIYAVAIVYPLRAWFHTRQSPTSASLLGFGVGNAVLFLTSQFSSFLFLGFPWVFLGLSMAAVDAAWSKRPLNT